MNFVSRLATWKKIVLLVLLIAIPIVSWAVITQRAELRKEASGTNQTVCWNFAGGGGDSYHWPDGCKGTPPSERTACTLATVQLTSSEVHGYLAWVNSGRPPIPGCEWPQPKKPVYWQTPEVLLAADDLEIVANGQTFKPHIASNSGLTVHSDPTGPGDMDYTTLEVVWRENGIEMRLFIYFFAETPPGTNSRQWGISEIRTYGGTAPGNWIYYRNRMNLGAVGSDHQTNTLTLTSDPNNNGVNTGTITFTNLHLEAFLKSNWCPGPNGTACQVSDCPYYRCLPGNRCPTIPCTTREGTCTNNVCVANPKPTVPPPPPSLTMDFLVRFAGVNDGRANGATATIRFVKGSLNLITPPLAFTHAGRGIYKARLKIPTTQLVPGDGYTIVLKGEKHVSRKFCKPAGQNAPCLSYETLTIPNQTSIITYDFSGLPLDPGDVKVQDGKANEDDFNKVKQLMNISCPRLSAADKLVGDLDYSGCVDSIDAFLMRRSMETRYDEN